MDNDPDFETAAPARRSRSLRDSEVVVVVSSDSESDSIPQSFYFSHKLFHFMCAGATQERIEQAGRKAAAIRKVDLMKRAERKERTDKLRNFIAQQGADKPSGPTLAATKRKRAVQKKNTAIQMGMGSRDKRKIVASQASQSDASQAQSQLSQPSQPQPQRRLYGSIPVPQSVLQGSHVEHQADGTPKPDKERSIRKACWELVREFTEPLDDLMQVDTSFSLPSTDYHVHGHILSIVVAHCTQIKTGNAFVRQVVDHRHQRFVLVCKLSEHLTGRKTERKVRQQLVSLLYIFMGVAITYTSERKGSGS
jgi:hypothetical protein